MNSYVTSQKGIDLIKSFEGCRLKAYKAVNTEQYYTIGFGHYGADVSKDMVITDAQAEAYLKQDLARFEKAVNSYNLSWMNQNRFDALVSFTYNCGAGNLRTLLNSGKRTAETVAEYLPKYNKSSGNVLAGLTRRRNAERALFMEGSAPVVNTKTYYGKYTGSSNSIVAVLKALGETDTSFAHRNKIANANGINPYNGTATQNLNLVALAKKGTLAKG